MRRQLPYGVVLVWLAASGAIAQPVPEPILRATLEPSRVIVGQPATLRVEVLAPNYMTAQPIMPDFQIRNAVTRLLGRTNISEQAGGSTFAGIRFEYAIFPQEAGQYEVAGQPVTVTYAAEPPKTREAILKSPDVGFQAFVPDAAASLRPFISAANVAVEQQVQRSAESLKVGDSVTRTITVRAEGTPAMLLPPAVAASHDGFAVYPAQPALQDNVDSRTGVLTAMRTDRATYIFEKPGDYTLPAVEIAWWNVREQKVERARADTVALHVIDNPAMRSGAVGGPSTNGGWHSLVDVVVTRWPLILVTAFALGSVVWMAPRMLRWLRDTYRRRHQLYLASEAWSFAELRKAARRGEPGAFYVALLAWLQRFAPAAPQRTIDALKKAANDPELDREIELLERQLYGNSSSSTHWSSKRLMRCINAARRRLMRTTTEDGLPLIPVDINPASGSRPVLLSRPVAR